MVVRPIEAVVGIYPRCGCDMENEAHVVHAVIGYLCHVIDEKQRARRGELLTSEIHSSCTAVDVLSIRSIVDFAFEKSDGLQESEKL